MCITYPFEYMNNQNNTNNMITGYTPYFQLCHFQQQLPYRKWYKLMCLEIPALCHSSHIEGCGLISALFDYLVSFGLSAYLMLNFRGYSWELADSESVQYPLGYCPVIYSLLGSIWSCAITQHSGGESCQPWDSKTNRLTTVGSLVRVLSSAYRIAKSRNHLLGNTSTFVVSQTCVN